METRSRTVALAAALLLVGALVATALFVLSRPAPDADVAAREPARAVAATADAADLQSAAPAPVPEPRPVAPEPERERRAQPADPALASAVWVSGIVAFPPGTPADERVTVTARGRRFRDREEPYHVVEVGADGSFRAAFAPRSGKARFLIEARYVRLSENESFELEDVEEPVVLEVELGGRIAGRLVLPPDATPEDAAALAGTAVHGFSELAGGMQMPRQGIVDDELRFTLDSLPAGVAHHVTYDGVLFVPAESDAEVRAGETTTLELALQSGVRIAGRVVDPDGAPIEGADMRSGWGGRKAQTDAEGRFALTGIEPGDVTLTTEVAGAAPVESELDALEDGTRIDDYEIVVGAGLALAGLVRWPDGAPASGAKVVVGQRVGADERFRYWDLVDLETETDAEGRFEIAGLETKRFDVVATARPRPQDLGPDPPRRPQDWSARVEDVGPSRDLVLALGPGLSLRGRVVDDLGAPLSRFTVEATPQDDEDEDEQPGIVRHLDADVSKSFRSNDGTFELAGLHAGRWRVAASAPRHGRSRWHGVDVPGGDGLLLTVPRAASIAGRVVDRAGNPVAGARVSVETIERESVTSFRIESLADRTGEDGAFEQSVDPGAHRLTASAHGLVTLEPVAVRVDAGEQRMDVLLVVVAAGAIDGHARRPDGGSAAGQSVQLSRIDGDAWDHATVAPDGSFRFEDVAPGRYEVELQPESSERDALMEIEGELDWEAWRALHATAVVVVDSGATVRVELGAGAGTRVRLEGTVHAGGEPLARVSVWVQRVDGGTSHASSETDAAGAYGVDLDAPGEYVVHVSAAGSFVRRSVHVPAVEVHRFDVEFPAGGLAGAARDASGRPLAGVAVHAEREGAGGASSASAETQADGTWSIARIDPGRWTVYAGGRSRPDQDAVAPLASRAGIEVRAGETTEGVDFVLGAFALVTGRVVDETGVPVDHAGVRLRSTDGRLVGAWRATTDLDGRFRIEDLGAGEYVLLAAGGDRVTSEGARVELRPGAAIDVELVARRGAWLEVRGRDDDDRPVAMTVHVADERGRDWSIQDNLWQAGFGWRTDEMDPEQRFGPLPRGRYVVRGTDGAGRVAQREVMIGDAPEERLVLRFD